MGRRGTSSDVTLFNFKLGDAVLSFVEASAYPDKVQSLVSALNIADQAVLKVDAADASFAEVVVALDASGLKPGLLVLGGVSGDSIAALTAGTVVSSYPVVGPQVVELRERLAGLRLDSGGDAVVQVDHSFPVKGVGTVALGVVKAGTVRKHDELAVFPGGVKASVKSVQVQDMDVGEACAGLRVGLALKDVEPGDVPRGSVLSTGRVDCGREFEVKAYLSKYSPRGLAEGDVFTLNASLNYVPARVVGGSLSPGGGGVVRLSLDREVPLVSGRVLFLDPGQRKPRVFGCGLV